MSRLNLETVFEGAGAGARACLCVDILSLHRFHSIHKFEDVRSICPPALKLQRDPQHLASQLDQLRQLNPEELRERWRSLFGADPPPKLRSSLLVQAIAYRLQEQALGGLKPATVRLLERIADDAAARRQVSANPEKIRVVAGTTLIREWHGTEHQVIVREHGIEFQGKQYNSLSQVAHRITGSKWSGRLFFRLKAKAQEHADG